MKKSILLVSMIAGLMSTSAVAGEKLDDLDGNHIKLKKMSVMVDRSMDFKNSQKNNPAYTYSSQVKVVFIQGRAFQWVFRVDYNPNGRFTDTHGDRYDNVVEYRDIADGSILKELPIELAAQFVSGSYCDLTIRNLKGLNPAQNISGFDIDLNDLALNGKPRRGTIDERAPHNQRNKYIHFGLQEPISAVLPWDTKIQLKSSDVTFACNKMSRLAADDQTIIESVDDLKKIMGDWLSIETTGELARQIKELAAALEKLSAQTKDQHVADETKKDIADAQESLEKAKKNLDSSTAKSAK